MIARRPGRSALSRRCRVLILALLLPCSAPVAGQDSDKLVQFDTPDQGANPLGREEKRYLAFGEAMYDYYSGRKFNALTRLLVNRQQGLFGQGDTDYAELLMGELYLTLGLPGKAETLFDKLLAKDLLQQTRAQTWFQKGVLHYEQGERGKAIEVLESDNIKGLPQRLQSRRSLMLANLYMGRENFASALEYLYDIPDDTQQGAYANYNMGVAMIRSGQQSKGIELLRTVMDMPEGDTENNALKDRAALAIGLTALDNDNYSVARGALQNVRADGPFSNEALLALGMANYDRGDPKKALPLWLELVQRDPGHKAVQEALMLAPRAYEDLGAKPQSLAGYQHAADTYRQELKNVETAIRQINETAWLEKLKPETPPERAVPDPMSGVDDYTAESGPQMAYLYKLFASHEFARLFRQYVQLDRLRLLLAQWDRALPAMGETLATQKSELAAALEPVREQLVGARQRQRKLENRANSLVTDIPARPSMERPRDVASYQELIMWNRIQKLEEEMGNATERQAERLRRVRGLLLWDIAKDAEDQRQQQQRDAENLVERSAQTGTRLQSVKQLVRDATQRVRGDMDERFSDKYRRLASLQEEVNGLIDDVKQVLKNDALEVLAERRQRLADTLGQARLAIARVQDESVSEDKQEKTDENTEASGEAETP